MVCRSIASVEPRIINELVVREGRVIIAHVVGVIPLKAPAIIGIGGFVNRRIHWIESVGISICAAEDGRKLCRADEEIRREAACADW